MHARGRPFGAGGIASVSTDTLVLGANEIPDSTTTFQQGDDAENGGAGDLLGNGLPCVDGDLIRLRAKLAGSSFARFPESGDPSVATRGNVPTASATRNDHVCYRNAASSFTPAAFSTTNAVRVSWVP